MITSRRPPAIAEVRDYGATGAAIEASRLLRAYCNICGDAIRVSAKQLYKRRGDTTTPLLVLCELCDPVAIVEKLNADARRDYHGAARTLLGLISLEKLEAED